MPDSGIQPEISSHGEEMAEGKETAHPRRFRWLRRSVLLSLALLSLIAGLRVWWGHEGGAGG